ncbi:thioesterase family protein [Leifsonia sp. ZF2019]|uniref:thioesterase family protein n=1 Tax=Leifsonia sp. ZF2019 TaxID=2781978 RepID=UPI001CC0D46E|nr:thioesterase family protein [Leifsonia sp. ZF2019]
MNPLAPTAYFLQTSERTFEPTRRVGGAWADDEIHFSPLGGLIAHAILRHAADRQGPPLQLGRISYDILGFLALEPVELTVETIRPGRTIELVEATAVIRGRAVVKARAWLLAAFDTAEVAGGASEGLVSPEAAVSWPMADVWRGGYVASLDARAVLPPEPGRATVWLSTPCDLVAGVEVDPVAAWLALVDTANGVAVRRHPTEWMFPNVDLTVHLHRTPAGPWLGLDTEVVFGATGLGVTRSVLHDAAGACGFAEQSLTIRKL